MASVLLRGTPAVRQRHPDIPTHPRYQLRQMPSSKRSWLKLPRQSSGSCNRLSWQKPAPEWRGSRKNYALSLFPSGSERTRERQIRLNASTNPVGRREGAPLAQRGGLQTSERIVVELPHNPPGEAL